MTARIAAVAVGVLLLFLDLPVLRAQDFLNMPSSPEANGRGEIFPSTDTDDPLAPLSNPGFMGFLAERNRVMVGFYPTHSSWKLPEGWGIPANLGYAGRTLAIGFDQTTLQKYFGMSSPLSFGFGYQETKYDYGESRYRDDQNNLLGVYNPYERAIGFSIGAGYHGRILQAGLGLNHKYITMDYTPNGVTHTTSSDFGLVIQSSVEKLLWGNNSTRTWQPTITPMISYVLANVGPMVYYGDDDIYGSPLPRRSAVGLNLSLGLRTTYFAKARVPLLSISFGEQVGDDDLASYSHSGGYYYKNPFGDLQPFNDLVLGKPHPQVARKQGIEISLLETAYLRWGHIKHDIRSNSSSYEYTSSGYGIRLAGLLKILETESNLALSPFFDRLLHHIDLQYHYGTQHADPKYNTVSSGISYHEIALLWRQ